MLAEIRGARGKDGADRSGRKHRCNRLRHVRHHRRNPVAGLYADRTQKLLQLRHERVQFIPRHSPRNLVFAPEDQRIATAALAQKVFSVVQPGIREEGSAGHLVAVDENARPPVADDATKIPQQIPECGTVLDRPAVQIGIVGEAPAGDFFGPLGEVGQRRAGDAGGARRP